MAADPSGLKAKEKNELGLKLQKKIDELTREIVDLEASLTQDDNSEKGAPDEVDRSSAEEEAQRLQLVLDRCKRLKLEVLEALKRLEDGTYGVCEETEEAIGFARLSATPWTRYSLEAQQALEAKTRATVRA